ncbi:MAG: Lrp/AsnC family transcriptional regulator [Candidatus Bathyarchaeia archaeon]|jgi:Lrp/AsnC family transcriptional regulator for asnA, asnC and gidA
MDELDYLILSEILLDAQESFLQIANKLDVSSFTVKSRYNKMVKEGIIRKSIISIDLARLGYQGKVFLLITNVPNQTKQTTISELGKIQNILLVSEIIGPFDIIAIAPVVDINGVKELVNQVKMIPSVQRVTITYINDTSFPINSTYGKTLSKSSRVTAANLKR